MKVVVVISSLARGGAQRVVSNLTREWAKSHQVLIALFDASCPAYRHGGELVDLDTPAIESPVKKLANALLRSVRLARILRQERPDRIVSFMESANFPTIVAASAAGLSQRLRVSVRIDPSMIPRLSRLMMPVAYRFAAQVVAPSSGVRQALQKMGLTRDRLTVIPNPVIRRRDATREAHADFPLRYVLGVGRLEPQKGFDRLLRAFSRVDSNQRGIQLVILGEGTERSGLLALSRELGIRSRFHLPGIVSDVDTWYRNAECFVLSSRYEGSPNVVIEAMANGCPVVSFDCRYGPLELLDGGRSGILVPQGDIAGLTDAIGRIVSDQSLRARLGKFGRRRAEAFSVEKVAPLWLRGPNDFGE